jgi:eukaryotic-like serine/threonine-protein kinase
VARIVKEMTVESMLFDRLMRRRGGDGRFGRLRNGAVTLGRYELVQPLGVGGMAQVFKARALGPGGFRRDVVVKRILPEYSRDSEFIRMFVDEAKILGLLHHPNIVQVYDFGEEDGLLFLALEYVEGPSLSRVLRTLRGANKKMPPAIVAFVAREICRALACVHELCDDQGRPLGAIHRDVTPSNVILTPAGEVKLLDFGVATFKNALQATKSGTVKGKPAYLAPEQLEGKTIDGRVDLFSLGIVMHEMLTLQHLFAGDSDLGTVKQIMEMEIPRPSANRDDVPESLERAVMRALARDRSQRFGTAAEMAAALDDFVVASKLHVGDVVSFVREVAAAATPLPVIVAPGGVRRGRRARAQRFEGDDPRPRKRAPLPSRRHQAGHTVFTRTRAAVALGVTLAMLGVGTAIGLRATSAAGHEAPPAPLRERAALIQR